MTENADRRDIKTREQFALFLREAGFSNRQALKIAAYGFRDADADADAEAQEADLRDQQEQRDEYARLVAEQLSRSRQLNNEETEAPE